jgi:2-polyprenyl-6-hydroxyphenyl methylase/3-demethylubiquinone-9 3-methyltransferase
MNIAQRNNLAIYDDVAAQWWSDDIRWVRTLKNMVPGRFSWFDQMTEWQGKAVLDLGCAGGFMTEALDDRGAIATGIDPAKEAIAAAKAHAELNYRNIRYDVGVGEALPYEDATFDAIVCVDVLEHVQDLGKVMSEIARVLRPCGMLFYDTINRNPLARLVTITIAEDALRILPKGTHDPEMFIKPSELKGEIESAGLVPGQTAGLGPRGINRRGDFVFGRIPGTFVIYMGTAQKPDTTTNRGEDYDKQDLTKPDHPL